MFQSDSIASSKQKILSKWHEEKDLCHDKPNKSEGYTLEFGVFEYEHSRPLSASAAKQAHDYIRAITKKYPFQLRYAMALPLWARFCQEWCDTGDEIKALRAI